MNETTWLCPIFWSRCLTLNASISQKKEQNAYIVSINQTLLSLSASGIVAQANGPLTLSTTPHALKGTLSTITCTAARENTRRNTVMQSDRSVVNTVVVWVVWGQCYFPMLTTVK